MLIALVSQTVEPRSTRLSGPVHRVRSVLLAPGFECPTVDEHTRTRLPAPGRWSQLGDVLIERGTGASTAVSTAASHPGVLVVAVHRGPHCWIRLGPDGTVCEFHATGPGFLEDTWEMLASLAHAWLVAGRPAAEFGSVPLCVLRVQSSCSPLSRCMSRRCANSASSDCERPTEE